MKLGRSFHGKQMRLCHCSVFDSCVFELLLFCYCLFGDARRRACAEMRKFLMPLVFCVIITMAISDRLLNLQHPLIYSWFDTILNGSLKSWWIWRQIWNRRSWCLRDQGNCSDLGRHVFCAGIFDGFSKMLHGWAKGILGITLFCKWVVLLSISFIITKVL